MITEIYQDKILDEDALLLKELVNMDTSTTNKSGVNQAQKLLSLYLQGMGFQTSLVPHPDGVYGDFLIAEYGNLNTKPITLIMHVDTVLAPSRAFKFSFDQYNQVFTGPGVADMKGGIMVGLRALRNLLQEHPHARIRVLSSPSEEVGSPGFHNILEAAGRQSSMLLGLEPATLEGDIISSRNGNRWYEIVVKGKSAHAGRFGEYSLNASDEMAHKIMNFHYLNDPERKIKANIGTFQGGDGKFNIVCGEARAKLDIRFPSIQDRDDLHDEITHIIKNQVVTCYTTLRTCEAEYTIHDDCPPMEYRLESESHYKKYLQCLNRVEGKPRSHRHSGGAADINYACAPGVPALDGLGVVGGAMHTYGEYMRVGSLVTRSQALEMFLTQLIIKEDL